MPEFLFFYLRNYFQAEMVPFHRDVISRRPHSLRGTAHRGGWR